MKFGIMSEQGAKRLGIPQGTPVKFEVHPSSDKCAIKVWREKDGVYVGGYVGIGHDGIIPSHLYDPPG